MGVVFLIVFQGQLDLNETSLFRCYLVHNVHFLCFWTWKVIFKVCQQQDNHTWSFFFL